jgi:hypothetical protein
MAMNLIVYNSTWRIIEILMEHDCTFLSQKLHLKLRIKFPPGSPAPLVAFYHDLLNELVGSGALARAV